LVAAKRASLYMNQCPSRAACRIKDDSRNVSDSSAATEAAGNTGRNQFALSALRNARGRQDRGETAVASCHHRPCIDCAARGITPGQIHLLIGLEALAGERGWRAKRELG